MSLDFHIFCTFVWLTGVSAYHLLPWWMLPQLKLKGKARSCPYFSTVNSLPPSVCSIAPTAKIIIKDLLPSAPAVKVCITSVLLCLEAHWGTIHRDAEVQKIAAADLPLNTECKRVQLRPCSVSTIQRKKLRCALRFSRNVEKVGVKQGCAITDKLFHDKTFFHFVSSHLSSLTWSRSYSFNFFLHENRVRIVGFEMWSAAASYIAAFEPSSCWARRRHDE